MLENMLMRSLVHGALGTRGRPFGGASMFLTGGRSSVFNLGNLLGAAGLAWGAYEAFGRRRSPETLTTVEGGGFGTRSETVVTTPPPIPTKPPPLPARTVLSADSGLDALRRLVALTIAAARCDKELSEEEYGRILASARESGGEALVAQELATQRPVAAIVAGADDPKLKADLYVLAYGIVRADGRVNESERTWLAELAGALGLDAAAVHEIQKSANGAIDAGGGA